MTSARLPQGHGERAVAEDLQWHKLRRRGPIAGGRLQQAGLRCKDRVLQIRQLCPVTQRLQVKAVQTMLEAT